MSIELNPATFEHEGVVYEAQSRQYDDCRRCAFRFQQCFDMPPCEAKYRPDGKNIRWVVRAQEGKKA